jgi:hypothetical protein
MGVVATLFLWIGIAFSQKVLYNRKRKWRILLVLYCAAKEGAIWQATAFPNTRLQPTPYALIAARSLPPY